MSDVRPDGEQVIGGRSMGGPLFAAIDQLATALAKAQGEMLGATKGSENPHFRSRYADLASIWDACRAPLSKHGLSVIQMPERVDNEVAVVTILCHASGQWISSRLSTIPAKLDPQAVGSCVTYLRRYALAAMVGIAPEDDDAEGATVRDASRPLPSPSAAPADQDAAKKWAAKFAKAKSLVEIERLKSEAKAAIKEHATLLAILPSVEEATKRLTEEATP